MPNELGELRRSTLVSTFGPGAIVDFRAGGAAVSAVIAGLESWDDQTETKQLNHPQTISEARLQKKLGVMGFRLPPVFPEDSRDAESLVAVRFPRWLQCPQCFQIRQVRSWARLRAGKVARYCPECTSARPGGARPGREIFVVPVRFVTACEAGHLDEFPWNIWVGHKQECQNRDRLVLESKAAGLAGLILSCPICKASRSLEGIFGEQALGNLPCRGRRPWLKTDDAVCPRPLRALQRGASNLYFPVTDSALDIPPWSDSLQRALGVHWEPIIRAPREDREKFVQILKSSVLMHMKQSAAEIVKAVNAREELLNRPESVNLRIDEYEQFISDAPIRFAEHKEFEIRREVVPARLQPYFDRIVRAVRLREVRAISGFTRINPPEVPGDDDPVEPAPISQTRLAWLPAIEVRGEGIFLRFNDASLRRWTENPVVQDRANKLDDAFVRAWQARREEEGRPTRVITPALVLVHTLSHVLMRQISLECGYSSASLRERLYVDDHMCGLLIYTATTDSDGTMGGLARQGEPGRLGVSVEAAIRSSEWCSSDPLCLEGLNSLSQDLNNAACHACVLAPETSCEEFNTLLDRAFLVGLPDAPDIGFFRPLLASG